MAQQGNQTEEEKRNMTYGALTNVVLVVSQSHRVNQVMLLNLINLINF